MKRYTLINRILLITILSLTVNCSLDSFKPQMPSWIVNLDVPLISTSVNFEQILPDSLITKIPLSPNGDPILYALRDTIPIDTVRFDTQIGIEPFDDGITTELGNIELNDISPTATDPYRFEEIYPEAGSISDGQEAIIPGFELDTLQKDFSFDDFSSAAFESGELEITINNQLQIDLYDIEVKLIDSGQEILNSVTFVNPIPPGDEAMEIMDLSGTTMPQNILVEVNGFSNGTSGATVAVDLDSYFEVKIGGQSLVVTLAIALIPPQSEPMADSGKVNLGISENVIKYAVFEAGNLEIEITNQIDLSGEVLLEIPSIQDNLGNSEIWAIPLIRDSISNHIVDLNEKLLVLYSDDQGWQDQYNPNGLPMDSLQVVHYSYEIFLDSSVVGVEPPDYREISADDSVLVTFSFYGETEYDSISFSQITGKIEDFEETIDPIRKSMEDLPEEMEDFLILPFQNNLGDALEMAIELSIPDIGIPIELNLTIIAKNEGESVSSSIRDWNIADPDSHRIVFPNPDSLINLHPDSIIVSGSAKVTDRNEIITFNVPENISMSGEFYLSLPFVFQISDSSTIETDPELVEQGDIPEEIVSIELYIDYENLFDFGAEVTVLAAADTNLFNIENNSGIPDTLIESLSIDPDINSKDTLFLDESKFDLFLEPVYLKTQINLFGADSIFFLSTDSLSLHLSASIQYMINKPKDE